MTEKEILKNLKEHKDCCKQLAEEYLKSYKKDKSKLALNEFFHCVISYNDYERVMADIEDRNAFMLFFSAPPKLTEKTVEVQIKSNADLEFAKTIIKDLLNNGAFTKGGIRQKAMDFLNGVGK